MATTCFFCKNLLSDYIEGILPSEREKEIEGHISGCTECEALLADLKLTMDFLKKVPSKPLRHEMALQISEASQSVPARARFTRQRVSRTVMFMVVPLLIFAGAVALFPSFFPWVTALRGASQDKGHFVRYFPLLQGASILIEEQAQWLHIRDPFMKSFWEEGGLSPEEFEKTFSAKGGAIPKEFQPSEEP